MPRGPRLDVPGTLHHVMTRGIEGSPIVMGDADRADFLDSLAILSHKTGTRVYAWALMTNHAHLLLKSSAEGLSSFMRKLLTGYAIRYNLRHDRHGYLFQNRYKSIVCQEDEYFVQLVAYIHLNPLRAGLVHSLDELDKYSWCGHAAIMGNRSNGWQKCEEVLSCFSPDPADARRYYREYLAGQCQIGKRPDLTGGGLIRSAGRWSEVKSVRGRPSKEFGEQPFDPRILGNGEFVAVLMQESDNHSHARMDMGRRKAMAGQELEDLCKLRSVDVELVKAGGKTREMSGIRKALAPRMVKELGLTLAETARMLGISTSGVAEILRKSGFPSGKCKE